MLQRGSVAIGSVILGFALIIAFRGPAQMGPGLQANNAGPLRTLSGNPPAGGSPGPNVGTGGLMTLSDPTCAPAIPAPTPTSLDAFPTLPPGGGDDEDDDDRPMLTIILPAATPTPTPSPTPAPSCVPATTSGASALPTTPTPIPAVVDTFAGPVVSEPFGRVQVQISVQGGKVVDIVALALPGGGYSGQVSAYAAPQLRAEALSAQSAQINTVSGATYTSNAYRQSLQGALDAAHV